MRAAWRALAWRRRPLDRPRRPAGLSTCSLDRGEARGLEDFRAKLATGPTLRHFLQGAQGGDPLQAEAPGDSAPYLGPPISPGEAPRKVYLETYGCQMNVSDTETAWTILQRSGYQRTSSLTEATYWEIIDRAS